MRKLKSLLSRYRFGKLLLLLPIGAVSAYSVVVTLGEEVDGPSSGGRTTTLSTWEGLLDDRKLSVRSLYAFSWNEDRISQRLLVEINGLGKERLVVEQVQFPMLGLRRLALRHGAENWAIDLLEESSLVFSSVEEASNPAIAATRFVEEFEREGGEVVVLFSVGPTLAARIEARIWDDLQVKLDESFSELLDQRAGARPPEGVWPSVAALSSLSRSRAAGSELAVTAALVQPLVARFLGEAEVWPENLDGKWARVDWEAAPDLEATRRFAAGFRGVDADDLLGDLESFPAPAELSDLKALRFQPGE